MDLNLNNQRTTIIMPKGNYGGYQLLSVNGTDIVIAKFEAEYKTVNIIIPYEKGDIELEHFRSAYRDDKDMYYNKRHYIVVSDRFYISGGINADGEKSLMLFDRGVFDLKKMSEKGWKKNLKFLKDAGVPEFFLSALGADWKTIELQQKVFITEYLEDYFGAKCVKMILVDLE